MDDCPPPETYWYVKHTFRYELTAWETLGLSRVSGPRARRPRPDAVARPPNVGWSPPRPGGGTACAEPDETCRIPSGIALKGGELMASSQDALHELIDPGTPPIGTPSVWT